MKREGAMRPVVVWGILMALTIFSTLVAEETTIAAIGIPAIFLVALFKARLVVMHYMEAHRAAPHWKILYQLWLVVVAALLIVGHAVTTPKDDKTAGLDGEVQTSSNLLSVSPDR